MCIRDRHNIQKCIKNLQKAHCLIVDKEQNEKGREYNRYSSISPCLLYTSIGSRNYIAVMELKRKLESEWNISIRN